LEQAVLATYRKNSGMSVSRAAAFSSYPLSASVPWAVGSPPRTPKATGSGWDRNQSFVPCSTTSRLLEIPSRIALRPLVTLESTKAGKTSIRAHSRSLRPSWPAPLSAHCVLGSWNWSWVYS